MDTVVVMFCVCMVMLAVVIGIGAYIITKLNSITSKFNENETQVYILKKDIEAWTDWTEALSKGTEKHIDITHELINWLIKFIKGARDDNSKILDISKQIMNAFDTSEKRYSDIYEQFNHCHSMLKSIKETLDEITTLEDEEENGPGNLEFYYSINDPEQGDQTDST